jgi:hypothetical protein
MSTRDIPSQPELLLALERLTHQASPLTLTRIFDGLLLKQDVQVVSVSGGTAEFLAGDLKLIAAPGGRYIYLHHHDLARPARALLETCVLHTCTFTLSELDWAASDWCERSQDRVRPKGPTYVTVRSPYWTLEGAVLDIDEAGMGMVVRSCGLPERGMQPRSHVQLDFPPLLDPPLRPLRGTIVHSEPINSALLRVGIRFQRNNRQASFFKAYAAERKAEILNEVDRAYYRSLEPRRVEDLFF